MSDPGRKRSLEFSHGSTSSKQIRGTHLNVPKPQVSTPSSTQGESNPGSTAGGSPQSGLGSVEEHQFGESFGENHGNSQGYQSHSQATTPRSHGGNGETDNFYTTVLNATTQTATDLGVADNSNTSALDSVFFGSAGGETLQAVGSEPHLPSSTDPVVVAQGPGDRQTAFSDLNKEELGRLAREQILELSTNNNTRCLTHQGLGAWEPCPRTQQKGRVSTCDKTRSNHRTLAEFLSLQELIQRNPNDTNAFTILSDIDTTVGIGANTGTNPIYSMKRVREKHEDLWKDNPTGKSAFAYLNPTRDNDPERGIALAVAFRENPVNWKTSPKVQEELTKIWDEESSRARETEEFNAAIANSLQDDGDLQLQEALLASRSESEKMTQPPRDSSAGVERSTDDLFSEFLCEPE